MPAVREAIVAASFQGFIEDGEMRLLGEAGDAGAFDRVGSFASGRDWAELDE